MNEPLKERALFNFETLLNYWKVDYSKLTDDEYDILASWRADKSFGSCRFNTKKGRGADFAGTYISEKDITLFGTGFTRDDFTGYSSEGQSKIGFDVVGLCQRIYHCNTYAEALKYLKDDVKEISKTDAFINPSLEAIAKRKLDAELKQLRTLNVAIDMWESAKYYPLKGSVGEKYLNSRGIYKLDKNIRFSPNILYTPTKERFAALVLKISKTPEEPIQAIHRIYLSPDGNKANVEEPKMALASVKGGAIWFGEPGPELWVAEGPENALTCLEFMGATFAVSMVYSTNIPNLTVPGYVKKVYIVPDPDRAGITACDKLKENLDSRIYLGLKVRIMSISPIKKTNGRFMDLNDLYMAG